MRYLPLEEVCRELGISAEIVETARSEGLIEVKETLDERTVISVDHAERLRLLALLTQELDVNLAGAEIILHMRERMIALHRQFDEILRQLVADLREQIRR